MSDQASETGEEWFTGWDAENQYPEETKDDMLPKEQQSPEDYDVEEISSPVHAEVSIADNRSNEKTKSILI